MGLFGKSSAARDHAAKEERDEKLTKAEKAAREDASIYHGVGMDGDAVKARQAAHAAQLARGRRW